MAPAGEAKRHAARRSYSPTTRSSSAVTRPVTLSGTICTLGLRATANRPLSPQHHQRRPWHLPAQEEVDLKCSRVEILKVECLRNLFSNLTWIATYMLSPLGLDLATRQETSGGHQELAREFRAVTFSSWRPSRAFLCL